MSSTHICMLKHLFTYLLTLYVTSPQIYLMTFRRDLIPYFETIVVPWQATNSAFIMTRCVDYHLIVSGKNNVV